MTPWRTRSWLALLSLGLLAGAANAQTLRWASQGDPQTMDPFSQNESLTNMINAQVYEFLVARDKDLAIVPGLATAWTQDGPLKWTFQLRPNVTFHDVNEKSVLLEPAVMAKFMVTAGSPSR